MLLILILNKQTNITSSTETQNFENKEWFSLITWETQTEGKLTVDAMTETDRVYASNQNGDTAQKCINIDMLTLLKEIVK